MQKKVDQKSLQAAIKDINKILECSPKLKFIGNYELLSSQVVNSITAALEAKDARLDNLAEPTRVVFNTLTTPSTEGNPATTEGSDPATTEGDDDCFAKSYDGSAPECQPDACGKAAECAKEMKKGNGAGKGKTTTASDEAAKAAKVAEKAAAKEAKKAEREKKKAEKAAAKAAKKAEKENAPPTAYSTMLDIICKNPDISKDDLEAEMKKTGLAYKITALRTALISTRSVVKRLRANGLMKAAPKAK